MKRQPNVVLIEYARPDKCEEFRGRCDRTDPGWSDHVRVRLAAWPAEIYLRYAERTAAKFQLWARRAAERRASAHGRGESQDVGQAT